MMHLEIITPDRTVYEGDVDAVSLPTPEGQITILGHHIPVVSVVIPGSIMVRAGGAESLLAVSRGVIEMDGDRLRILADTAENAEELDEEVIERAKTEARELMQKRRGDAEGFAEAQAILDREIARLQVARMRRRTHKRPMV